MQDSKAQNYDIQESNLQESNLQESNLQESNLQESSNNVLRISLAQIRRQLDAGNTAPSEEFITMLTHDPRKGARELLRLYLRRLEQQKKEAERLEKIWKKERSLAQSGYFFIAGIDEVGRGPLAGPVVAASVILPLDLSLPKLNDSKKLSPQARELLTKVIKEKAISWGIGIADQRVIERINILQATKKAMLAAVAAMSRQPDYLLIDALEIPTRIPQEGIIHGDSNSASIAAASILAKTYRDNLMEQLDVLYPEYGFKEHKGYGTPRHLAALREFGMCPLHRRNFCSGLLG